MKHRRITALVVASTAVVTLGACSSEPSTKTVARELVESYADQLTDEEQSCLLGVVEGYSNDELSAIGDDGVNKNYDGRPESLEDASPAMREFVADLEACGAGEPTATTDESTATTEATDETGSTDVTDTTESTDDTETTDAGESTDTTEPTATTEG